MSEDKPKEDPAKDLYLSTTTKLRLWCVTAGVDYDKLCEEIARDKQVPDLTKDDK